jgi:hypothetical protein
MQSLTFKSMAQFRNKMVDRIRWAAVLEQPDKPHFSKKLEES